MAGTLNGRHLGLNLVMITKGIRITDGPDKQLSIVFGIVKCVAGLSNCGSCNAVCVCLCNDVFVYLYVIVCLFDCLFVCLVVCLLVCLFAYLLVCLRLAEIFTDRPTEPELHVLTGIAKLARSCLGRTEPPVAARLTRRDGATAGTLILAR